MTKVSVVMPVYNAARFLDESVNSILNQTLDDLELICVDDGSTDDSLSILNDFASKDDRVKVFSLDHQGGGNARNYGLTQITGEYLFCMDADDTLDLNAFEDFDGLLAFFLSSFSFIPFSSSVIISFTTEDRITTAIPPYHTSLIPGISATRTGMTHIAKRNTAPA